MSGIDWEGLVAEARLPETRARMLDLIEATTRIRERHAGLLTQANEQLAGAKASREDLDRLIEVQAANIAQVQAMVEDLLADIGRLQTILRDTAGSMN